MRTMTEQNAPKRVMNRRQAAAYLGVSTNTLVRWFQKNAGPAMLRIGKRRYYSREVLDQWLKSHSAVG